MQKKKCLCRDLIIKSICCVFLYALLPVSSVFGQEQDYKKTRVTLNVKDMKLNDVLDTLASVAKVRFFYNHSQVDVNKKESFNVNIEVYKKEFLGGTRTIVPEKNILIDNSFKTRLIEEQEQFAFTF